MRRPPTRAWQSSNLQPLGNKALLPRRTSVHRSRAHRTRAFPLHPAQGDLGVQLVPTAANTTCASRPITAEPRCGPGTATLDSFRYALRKRRRPNTTPQQIRPTNARHRASSSSALQTRSCVECVSARTGHCVMPNCSQPHHHSLQRFCGVASGRRRRTGCMVYREFESKQRVLLMAPIFKMVH